MYSRTTYKLASPLYSNLINNGINYVDIIQDNITVTKRINGRNIHSYCFPCQKNLNPYNKKQYCPTSAKLESFHLAWPSKTRKLPSCLTIQINTFHENITQIMPTINENITQIISIINENKTQIIGSTKRKENLNYNQHLMENKTHIITHNRWKQNLKSEFTIDRKQKLEPGCAKSKKPTSFFFKYLVFSVFASSFLSQILFSLLFSPLVFIQMEPSIWNQ